MNYGYIYKEIADKITPLQRRDEAVYWVKHYCWFAKKAKDNTDYQEAFRGYAKKMYDARMYSMVYSLLEANLVSRHAAWRYPFVAIRRIRSWLKKMVS